MRRVVTSARAELRFRAAATWLAARGVDEQVLILGASYESASELIRFVARERGSGFGWHRMTLGRLAAELAKLALADRERAPIGSLPIEAICARVLHGMRAAGTLGRLEAVADQPGLPRALARTLGELRMARVEGGGPELRAALAGLVAELERGKLADRAGVFEVAEQLARGGTHALLGLPTLVLDVRLRSRAEQTLLDAVLAASPDALATVPGGDEATLARIGGEVETLAVPEVDALSRVQKHLFDRGRLNYASLDRSIEIFSAPGESRECVEIARRVLAEAAAGVPFDRMAIALRSPGNYRAHLEEAFGRADVPVYFEQGTIRPHPSGRAFLALLACASEGLSARRFAEYLSLGEVPDAIAGAPPPAAPVAERWVAPDEELSPAAIAGAPSPEAPRVMRSPAPDPAVTAGTLRAPWRWEQLLVEAAVIGGRARWERRLAGLEARLALADPDGGSDRVRQLDDLRHLRAFAMPLLAELAELPARATWGTWIDRLTALATRALRAPERVLATLSALVPMSEVGPITLRDVQLVLAPRLGELIEPRTTRRYGHVWIAPVEALRGMTFDLVFVPGLAERMFPPKLIEDPLLLDPVRAELGELATRETRIADERLALRLAIGAACKRAVVSYPRIDLDQGRPRVPSFYGLEVLESAEGALPGFDELGKRAEATGAARIGWPAPSDRERAIDEAEHDLALLDGLLTPRTEAPVGAAVYLLQTNPHLARSLRFRARRWTVASWKPADGLIAESEAGRAALDAHAPGRRAFSPTALEQLAACPYKFALRSVLRLEPREEPEAIETLGPLERGSLIHDIHFELLTELRAAGELPVRDVEGARARLDAVIARVAARYRDDLCPAIDRVWDDGIAAIAADAREWLRRMVEDASWIPRRFELAFGLTGREAADPASVAQPVDLGLGLSLRGSIDLVEEHLDGTLRATDYKTGIARVKPGAVTAGGTSLQPVLYALVLERLFAARVAGGRLDYCTSRGEFRSVEITLGDEARGAARVLADTVAHHFERRFFPAAPARGACQYCDYRSICGPFEEVRIQKKKEPLVQLSRLRGQR